MSILLKILGRIISVAIYAYPFLEIYCFFGIYLHSLGWGLPDFAEEGAYILKENTWLNFLMFTVILILTQARRLNISYFVRYNLMQALLLIFLCNFSDTCVFLFPRFCIGEGSIGYPIFNVCSFLIIVLIIYCTLFAIIGKIPNVPVLSTSVRMQLWTE